MTLCDASPLIALINEADKNHQRCVDILSSLSAPLVTTCACFTEAMYLLRRYGGWFAQQELWGYVVDEILVIHHHNSDELKIFTLDSDFYIYRRYGNQPFEVVP